MAENTTKALRNCVMYSVFVRNYSEAGTFQALERDLHRIKDLGVDIIWLMPIHPCGVKNRKGNLGSSYAIRDYRAVNPEFGTLEDFKSLVSAIHKLGMKCIIDVVYNHTSPDSVLAHKHPEWFYHKADGSFGNRIGDWWDVIDLDYSNRDLWEYQIDTLKMWVGEYQVDGFRCDVAPIVPVAFWKAAREAVEEVHHGCIWLAESGELPFITYTRGHGIPCASDSELYQAFDICYDYDMYHRYIGYLSGKNTLTDYANALNLQEYIYPDNYDKLRFLENHDKLRGAFLIRDERARRNWTALSYFLKGTTLIYNGQERSADHVPSLFDKDNVSWDGTDLTMLMRKLYSVCKELPVDCTEKMYAASHDIMVGIRTVNASAATGKPGSRTAGVFCLGEAGGLISVNEYDIPDGIYTDLIHERQVEVSMGHLSADGEPLVFSLDH
ncbi:MAG: alpha-amylase [Eubacterium sp.]|nr:alpha-amylase [Eubacterium sp.]